MSCEKNFEFKEWYYNCCCEVELKVDTQLIHKKHRWIDKITQVINTTCGKTFYATVQGGVGAKTKQQIVDEYYIVVK